MRLLHAKTLKLEDFFSDAIPPYAILSHTWGSDEITFGTFAGYKGGCLKIDGCCQQALKAKLNYVWIDTICIDKSSSAELSEAINSMYAWYRSANICYAYLADVPEDDSLHSEGSAFRGSRWFTRGWTLQELLAPSSIDFFSATWKFLGNKNSDVSISGSDGLIDTISTITGIKTRYLTGTPLDRASIAERMSWAGGRHTTRIEDRAYSLLGIFDINMPMLYGEGTKAFTRLQEEIMKTSDDQTILAWGFGLPPVDTTRLLAISPDDFKHGGQLELRPSQDGTTSEYYMMTNVGLQIKLPLTNWFQDSGTVLALLTCMVMTKGHFGSSIALTLQKDGADWCRCPDRPPLIVTSTHYFRNQAPQRVYLRRAGRHVAPWSDRPCPFTILSDSLNLKSNTAVFPPTWRSITDETPGRTVKTIAFSSSENAVQDIFILCHGISQRSYILHLVCELAPPNEATPIPKTHVHVVTTPSKSASLLALSDDFVLRDYFLTLPDKFMLKSHGSQKQYMGQPVKRYIQPRPERQWLPFTRSALPIGLWMWAEWKKDWIIHVEEF